MKFGVVEAQVALALAGVDRERILALLLESIAASNRTLRDELELAGKKHEKRSAPQPR